MTLFFDHLLNLNNVEERIKNLGLSFAEREEITKVIDSILNHHLFSTLLTKLPEDKHHEFMSLVHTKPFSEEVLEYLKDTIMEDVDELIQTEAGAIGEELILILETFV